MLSLFLQHAIPKNVIVKLLKINLKNSEILIGIEPL